MSESNALNASLNRLNETPPEYVFHYGSMAGLLGVLQSKAIWASDVSSLNDKSEIVHANEVLEQALGNRFFSMGIKDNVWFHGIALQVRSIKARIGRCVASFCEDNDQLSLWRPYASDGMGASIGFQSSAMSKVVAEQGFELKKVVYDRETQYAICIAYVDDLFGRFGIDSKIAGLPDDVIDDMRNFINTVGILFKHPSFRDEREWRLVSADVHLYDPRWKYRSGPNMIVPYLVVDFHKVFERDPEVIEKDEAKRPPFIITLGPRVRTSPTSQALQAITHSILGQGHGVTLSDSPYQG
jgi:hypothetical protein